MAKKKKYKIATIVGARPQFVKAAALSRAINNSEALEEVIVHSGQHYDHNLSGGFFEELGIPAPKYNLAIGSKSHNKLIGEFLLAFDDILVEEKPDLVLVYGDTNTTAAGAIGAAKRNIPIAHVEAGLREFDKTIPEEINKLITDSVTDLYFSPTQTGADNLRQVGIEKNVFVTGDISLDLLFENTNYTPLAELKKQYNLQEEYIFMTCHREANTATKEPLQNILQAVSNCGKQVIFPMHPRTKAAVLKFNLGSEIGTNVNIIKPIGFWQTQSLLKNASLTITDSGGIIKETYFHKVPGIIIDRQTEWVETVAEGWNVITGPDKSRILEAIQQIKTPKVHTNALGDGRCGERIVRYILEYLG